MGCFGSSEISLDDRVLKWCVLGIVGSGKSTFIRQLRVLDNQLWDEDQLKTFRETIRRDLLLGMQEMFKRCEALKIEIAQENRKYARTIAEKEAGGEDLPKLWDEDTIKKLRVLWADPAFKKAFEASTDVQTHMTHLGYFMDQLDEIVKDDYLPSTDDILRLRMRTTTVYDTTFDIEKYRWVVSDCGGQKSERAKWPKILDASYHAILYFVAVDEYNIISSEDMVTTRLKLALDAFHAICEDDKTQRQSASIILILNRMDLFTPKFKKNPASFKAAFPSFNGNTQDEALEFITALFSAKLPSHVKLTSFRICSLDAHLVQLAFDEMRSFTLSWRLQLGGL